MEMPLDLPSSNFKDLSSSNFKDLPSSNFKDLPSSNFKDLSSSNSKDLSSSNFKDLSLEQLNSHQPYEFRGTGNLDHGLDFIIKTIEYMAYYDQDPSTMGIDGIVTSVKLVPLNIRNLVKSLGIYRDVHLYKDLPEELFSLFPNVRSFQFTALKTFRTIPANINIFSNLTSFSAPLTNITMIPEELCECITLKALDLAETSINAVPQAMTNLVHLQLLCLAFTCLPKIHARNVWNDLDVVQSWLPKLTMECASEICGICLNQIYKCEFQSGHSVYTSCKCVKLVECKTCHKMVHASCFQEMKLQSCPICRSNIF